LALKKLWLVGRGDWAEKWSFIAALSLIRKSIIILWPVIQTGCPCKMENIKDLNYISILPFLLQAIGG
jgi:hypothetical protein